MEKERRKEIANAYKLTRQPMGVYQIRNKINEKILLGSNANLNAIWNRERSVLRFGSHLCKELQADWQTWGESNFEFSVLEYLKTDEKMPLAETQVRKRLKEMEEAWMERLQPYENNGYNRRLTCRVKNA